MKYLFLHGLGQTASSWNRVLETLHHKADAFCPNLPDFLQGGPCGYPTLYEAFSSYCSHISESINLCGLSLGGILAMQYAIEHPEKVHSLVLIGTPYPMPRRLLRLQNAISRLMPTRMFANMGFQKQDFKHILETIKGTGHPMGGLFLWRPYVWGNSLPRRLYMVFFTARRMFS